MNATGLNLDNFVLIRKFLRINLEINGITGRKNHAHIVPEHIQDTLS